MTRTSHCEILPQESALHVQQTDLLPVRRQELRLTLCLLLPSLENNEQNELVGLKRLAIFLIKPYE